MRRSIKIILSLVFVFSLSATSIFAARVTSPTKTSTVFNYTYSYFSVLQTIGQSVEAEAWVQNPGGIHAGYAGAQARIYRDTGGLEASSKMVYIDGRYGTLLVVSPRVAKNGNWYASSLIELYNGNGYNQFTTYDSPRITLPTSTFSSSQKLQSPLFNENYKVNKNGETYGKGLGMTNETTDPDLIEAYGVDGTLGYVRSTDLNPTFSTPEEALLHNPQNNSYSIIPLYDKDGNEIGSFETFTSYESK